MVAGGTQAETVLAEALQGASGDTHTRVGHHLGGWVPWARLYLKTTLTSVALRRTRGASRIMQHP